MKSSFLFLLVMSFLLKVQSAKAQQKDAQENQLPEMTMIMEGSGGGNTDGGRGGSECAYVNDPGVDIQQSNYRIYICLSDFKGFGKRQLLKRFNVSELKNLKKQLEDALDKRALGGNA